jgi:type VI secretion system secreted protein VgrG
MALGSSDSVMSITTTAGAGKLLVLRMEGREELGRLPEWRVDLVGNVTALGTREPIVMHSLLGTRANVALTLHGTTRDFNGFITRMQRGERHGRFETFSIIMRPWLWFATRTKNSKVFQNKSVKDIVTEVLTPYSADFAWRLLLASTYTPL